MGFSDFMISWGGTKAVLVTLTKQDPEELGKQSANLIDKLLDDQMGEKRSELIQKKFVPWFTRFAAVFMTTLLGDNDELDKKRTKKRT